MKTLFSLALLLLISTASLAQSNPLEQKIPFDLNVGHYIDIGTYFGPSHMWAKVEQVCTIQDDKSTRCFAIGHDFRHHLFCIRASGFVMDKGNVVKFLNARSPDKADYKDLLCCLFTAEQPSNDAMLYMANNPGLFSQDVGPTSVETSNLGTSFAVVGTLPSAPVPWNNGNLK